MEPLKPGMTDTQIDALVETLSAEGGDKLLAEMLKEESPQPPSQATSPKEIRARMKEIASKTTQLIAKIIDSWMKEERRKR